MNAFVYKKLKVIVAIFSVITLMACGKKSTPPVTAGSEDPPVPTYNLAWQTVGAEIADQASLISLKVFNGTPYIAYKGFLDSKAHVKKYDGSSWVEVLSGTPATSDDVLFVKMDIDSLGNIFIAYTDPNASNALRVRKFNGTSWSNIITADPTAKLFAIDLYNDQPCITYIDSSDRIAAMLYDGTTWSSHTTSYKAENYISIHVDELASPAATAYIAFRDSNNANKISVLQYILGGSITVLGTGFSDNAASYITISVNSDHTPYVSYRDDVLLKSFAMKYDTGAWSKIGNNGITTGDAEALSMYIYNKTLAVCYQDETNSDKISAKISDGTSWFNFGIQGFSDNAVTETSIFVDSAESYVAYIDKTTNKITVKKY